MSTESEKLRAHNRRVQDTLPDVNARFDYGHLDPSKGRSPYRISSYDFKSSQSDGPMQNTGNYADNAILDLSGDGEDASLVELKAMLEKAGVSEDELKAGVELTQTGYQKVAARLGVDVNQVKTLINTLTTHERKEQDTLNELSSEGPRFVEEHDFMGNVTVRDTSSGDEEYYSGSEAMEILTLIDGQQPGSPAEQRILSQYTDKEHELQEASAKMKKNLQESPLPPMGAGAKMNSRRLRDLDDLGDEPDRRVEPERRSAPRDEPDRRGGIDRRLKDRIQKFVRPRDVEVVNDEFSPEETLSESEQLHLNDHLKAVLKEYEEINGNVDFAAEIANDVGTFNFPWKLGDHHGTATASYKGKGDHFFLSIIEARDEDGNELEDSRYKKVLHQQGIDFIGQE